LGKTIAGWNCPVSVLGQNAEAIAGYLPSSLPQTVGTGAGREISTCLCSYWMQNLAQYTQKGTITPQSESHHYRCRYNYANRIRDELKSIAWD